MPQFIFSTAMTANQLGLNPLAGWQYEYLQMWPANVLLLVRSTTTGNRITIYSGSETIRERTPIQAGGTAGTTPSELNTPADSWVAAAGDRLKLTIDEVAGGEPTLGGIIILNPPICKNPSGKRGKSTKTSPRRSIRCFGKLFSFTRDSRLRHV